jgi:hypothetical protein
MRLVELKSISVTENIFCCCLFTQDCFNHGHNTVFNLNTSDADLYPYPELLLLVQEY